jgi:beta-lactamase regulating signal transducer with metallopeptidase domain
MIQGLLFSGAVRAAVVLGVGLAACALLARASAAARRLALVITLGAAVAVPALAALGPRWTVEAPTALTVFARESANETAPAGDPGIQAASVGRVAHAGETTASSLASLDPTTVLAVLWLAVAAALLVRAASSHLRAQAIVRRATAIDSVPWGDAARAVAGGRPLEVRASSELDSPAVTGLLWPTIVVPLRAVDWPEERCRMVLIHELAHVRCRDVLAQALADVACALHWCNPLVWICARRLRVEREIAADDAVLASGVRPSHYAEELLAVATSLAAPRAALAMAERTSLEARVRSILASGLARSPLAARGTIAVVAAGALLTTAAACTSPEVSAPPRMTERGTPPGVGTANDPAMQRAADEEIAAIAAEWSPELATIVVLDPATGEILANAGQSAGKAVDVASTVAMAPGSTLKPITIAAALELGAITASQSFDCGPDPRMYGDKAFHDASANGTLDLAHLLAVSSNIGMSRVFDALGGDNLTLWLHRFHFGDAPALLGATTGTFPAHVANGSFEGAALAIGTGMTATPLQMIAAYGAIAGDGVYHAPTHDRGGSRPERLFSSGTASSVMALLETAVVDAAATGKAARAAGVHVAGKTGTSEWTGPDGHERTYASFIGVADLPSHRVVALVGIQGARNDLWGGKAAAPVFARLVERIRGS